MALIRGEQISGSVASANFALTASYALNANGGTLIATGSVSASVGLAGDVFIIKSGSLNLLTLTSSGSLTISGSADVLFLVKNTNNTSILQVSQSGVITLATQSSNPSGTAPNGGITFTATDFFVGLD